MDLDWSVRIISSKASEVSDVNFQEEHQDALRRFCNVTTKEIPVLFKGDELWSTDRDIASGKYRGKRPTLFVAFVREYAAQNILLVRN